MSVKTVSVKHYHLNGAFIGTFVDGASPDAEGAAECPTSPQYAWETWNGAEWEGGETPVEETP